MKHRHLKRHTVPGTGRKLYCHCGRPAVLRSAEGICKTYQPGDMVYVCSAYPACDSYVMAHPHNHMPMGSLAGPELRKLRQETHRQFDQLFRSGLMTRTQAYQWLGHIVQAPRAHAHIGHLGDYYCREVIRESRKLLARHRGELPEPAGVKSGGDGYAGEAD